MHCELNPKIVYTEFNSVVRKQKEIVKQLICRQQKTVSKVHSGLSFFKEGFYFFCDFLLPIKTKYF